MFNVLLDPLPQEWEGYPIDPDFQIGIQISQCLEDPLLNDREKICTAAALLFPDENNRPDISRAMEGVSWFLNEYDHDRHGKNTSEKRLMDFDIDQWRIYAAFLSQYGIDLNTAKMHWFVFMGLLSNLGDCSFGAVIDIRQRKFSPGMPREERKYLSEKKKIYSLEDKETELSFQEKERENAALLEFNRMRNKG